eukprot:GHVN01056123.1.p1 GENE.GHVN01056123.1~~GHVN01056123.1.p1  ORF type:complete len:485 (+),score=67.44 GHVN01056123.1:200-1654(+)
MSSSCGLVPGGSITQPNDASKRFVVSVKPPTGNYDENVTFPSDSLSEGYVLVGDTDGVFKRPIRKRRGGSVSPRLTSEVGGFNGDYCNAEALQGINFVTHSEELPPRAPFASELPSFSCARPRAPTSSCPAASCLPACMTSASPPVYGASPALAYQTNQRRRPMYLSPCERASACCLSPPQPMPVPTGAPKRRAPSCKSQKPWPTPNGCKQALSMGQKLLSKLPFMPNPPSPCCDPDPDPSKCYFKVTSVQEICENSEERPGQSQSAGQSKPPPAEKAEAPDEARKRIEKENDDAYKQAKFMMGEQKKQLQREQELMQANNEIQAQRKKLQSLHEEGLQQRHEQLHRQIFLQQQESALMNIQSRVQAQTNQIEQSQNDVRRKQAHHIQMKHVQQRIANQPPMNPLLPRQPKACLASLPCFSPLPNVDYGGQAMTGPMTGPRMIKVPMGEGGGLRMDAGMQGASRDPPRTTSASSGSIGAPTGCL